MKLLATFKHISSKNADYGAAEAYLTFEHDEFTMKPTLDENGRLVPREGYRLATLNCGEEDFAVACLRSNLRYGKNQKREDVKSHHYIISFDPRDGTDNGLTVDKAQSLGEEFCNEHFPGHQAIVCTHPDGHNHSGNIHVHIVINSLRIEAVPLLPYMDRPADTKDGCKHRCTDAAMEYFKSEVMEMADALASMLRNAGGTMTTVAHSKEEYARYTEGITDVMSYLGIDTSKDFTVNGMKYSKNKDGWYESEANSDAQAAYEQLKANNRTYQFADEKTKKQIAYISDYYLQTVPESVKAAWQETLEETGFNPFQTDVTSTLTQLSVEQDFLTGGDDNIFGETKESCLAAIDKVLERIENPLAAVTEERAAYLQQEKEFYTVLASKIRE